MSQMNPEIPSQAELELRRIEKVGELAGLLAEDRGRDLRDDEIEGLFGLYDRLTKAAREIGQRVLRRKNAPWN